MLYGNCKNKHRTVTIEWEYYADRVGGIVWGKPPNPGNFVGHNSSLKENVWDFAIAVMSDVLGFQIVFHDEYDEKWLRNTIPKGLNRSRSRRWVSFDSGVPKHDCK